MGACLNLVTPLHTATKRDYLARMLDNKVDCMKMARVFEYDYWDGERRYGYGGYHYQTGRWNPVAAGLIERYDLKPGDAVLDLGCGKGFLLYEMQLLMPRLELVGIDRSDWAISHKHPDLRATLINERVHGAKLPIADKSFDLVISLGMLHNLRLFELARALQEIERIGRRSYLMVESFRDEAEWFNLVCWCLTAETIMRPEDWEFLYGQHCPSSDYEFIFFG